LVLMAPFVADILKNDPSPLPRSSCRRANLIHVRAI
jgi:hypothetical protein